MKGTQGRKHKSRKPRELYVVLVTHNTGHGDEDTVMLITRDLVQAVSVAKTAEEYGYQFYNSKGGVVVTRLVPGRVYAKCEFKWNLGSPPPRTVVFSTRFMPASEVLKKPQKWVEEWFDKKAERQFNQVVVGAGQLAMRTPVEAKG